MSLSSRTVITRLVQARADESALAWLTDACRRLHEGEPRRALLDAYTEAPRRLGREPVVLTESETVTLHGVEPDLSLVQWTVGDLGRGLLLLTADEPGPKEPHATELLEAVYHEGDTSEQQSWLLAVPLLQAPERFLDIAVDTCRTNILPLFEAVACENPFPMRAFPELNFNQLVMKALFNYVSLARIVGLDRRANPELTRMANAYASERAAAGRTVPPDIGRITGEATHS